MKASSAIDVASVSKANMAAVSERRKNPRYPCEGTGDVIVLGGALHFPGILHDLSAIGCCLTTFAPFTLERGTQVEAVMVVKGIQFRVAAGVRAINSCRGVGLEFMHVSPRNARLIQDLIVELELDTKRKK